MTRQWAWLFVLVVTTYGGSVCLLASEVHRARHDAFVYKAQLDSLERHLGLQ